MSLIKYRINSAYDNISSSKNHRKIICITLPDTIPENYASATYSKLEQFDSAVQLPQNQIEFVIVERNQFSNEIPKKVKIKSTLYCI